MHSAEELFYISELLRFQCPERIVEYGTGEGGLTVLLGRWAGMYQDVKVLSIENHTYTKFLPRFMQELQRLPVEVLVGDEFSQAVYERVQVFVRDHKTFFYCDGGAKKNEFDWCSRLLKPDDLVVTHDYNMTKEQLACVTLPEPIKELGHVTVAQMSKLLVMHDLEPVFVEDLKQTRLFAARKKR
jgi:predicted O-methyltransferase YrrM